MRTTLITSAIALGLLACNGTTSASAFVGTWSCVNDSDGSTGLVSGPQQWTLTLVENADGTVSPVNPDTVASPASGVICTPGTYEYTVAGAVAKSPTVVCQGNGDTGHIETTFTLSGSSLISDEEETVIQGEGPYAQGATGNPVLQIIGTCTKS
jgi:hypothetical protein